MFHAADFGPEHLGDGEAVDQHQNDNGRDRHAEHADTENCLRYRLVAGEVLQRPSQLKGVATHEHRGKLLVSLVGFFAFTELGLYAG